jgi:hypothetical protein
MGSFLRDGKDGVHHALCLGCFEAVSKRHMHGMGAVIRQGHGNVAPHGERCPEILVVMVKRPFSVSMEWL